MYRNRNDPYTPLRLTLGNVYIVTNDEAYITISADEIC